MPYIWAHITHMTSVILTVLQISYFTYDITNYSFAHIFWNRARLSFDVFQQRRRNNDNRYDNFYYWLNGIVINEIQTLYCLL